MQVQLLLMDAVKAFTACLLDVEGGSPQALPLGTKRTIVAPVGAPIEALGPALVEAFALRGRGARFSVMSSTGSAEEATFEARGNDFDAEVAMADDAWVKEPTEMDAESTTASSGDPPSPHDAVADVEMDHTGLEAGDKVFSDAAKSPLVRTTPLVIPAAAKETPAGAVFAPVPAGAAPLPANGTSVMYGLEFADGRFFWLQLEPQRPSNSAMMWYCGNLSAMPTPTPDHAPIVL